MFSLRCSHTWKNNTNFFYCNNDLYCSAINQCLPDCSHSKIQEGLTTVISNREAAVSFFIEPLDHTKWVIVSENTSTTSAPKDFKTTALSFLASLNQKREWYVNGLFSWLKMYCMSINCMFMINCISILTFHQSSKFRNRPPHHLESWYLLMLCSNSNVILIYFIISGNRFYSEFVFFSSLSLLWFILKVNMKC